MTLRAFSPNSLKAQAYQILKNAIIRGDLEDNEMITEQFVLERFNVSRTPYREAIQALEAEGWVYSIPYKGTYVKPVTLEDVLEVFDLRLIIEPSIAKKVQSESKKECSKYLQENLEEMKRQSMEMSDYDFILQDHKFHKIFYEQTKNTRIQNVSNQLYDIMLRLGIRYGKTARREDVIREHTEIIQELMDGNVEQAVYEHLERAKQSFLDN